ncbi:MAG: hypothetical protein O2983_03500 [Planctomycetota bacterium]|nr:hypothetical protein [Planctomycetota bacterium]MDA0919152.1 hypothetical protein [Planctomycetota bacterium]MDA1158652.1 hypothetical protein [Planctomycetota bacterium]
MTGSGKYWQGNRAASAVAWTALGLSLLCSATGCEAVFGQAAIKDSSSGDTAQSSDGVENLNDQPSATEESDLPDETPLPEVEVAVRNPEELLAEIQESLSETRNKKRPKGRVIRETWQAAQEQYIAAGVLACAELVEHEAATDEQLREAWKSKAVLLYRAAEYGWPEFDDRLSRTVDQLKQTSFVEEAEYADGLLLVHRCFERNMPVHEVVERLSEHAREFPGGDTCARLFVAYAKKLEDRGLKNSARLCCQAAVWTLHDHPEIDSIRHQLSVLDAKANIARNWAAVSASVQLKPDDAIQQELDLQVAQIRAVLPIRVDSATTLTDVSAGSHSINYRYTVTISAQQMELQKESIRQKVTQLARSVHATRMILAKGVTLNYSYNSPEGSQLLFFSVTD